MQRSLRSTVAVLGLTAVTFPGAAVLAGDSKAPPEGSLSPDEIVRRLEAAGYTNVHDVEFDDGRYEAEATSAGGAAVDLDIDAVTGKVTQEEPD